MVPGLTGEVGPEAALSFSLVDWSGVMTITDSCARERQETIRDARDVLFCIPSLTRTCFQPLPSVVGHHLYKTITNFVKEIAGCQMQRFTLQYGQGFA